MLFIVGDLLVFSPLVFFVARTPWVEDHLATKWGMSEERVVETDLLWPWPATKTKEHTRVAQSKVRNFMIIPV